MVLNNSSADSGAVVHHKSTVRQVVAVFLFIIIISTTGNSMVVIAIYRFHNLRTISNLIILNLSITDLLFSLLVIPSNASTWFTERSNSPTLLCSFIGVSGELLSLVSIYSLVFISLERFLATSYPLKHRSKFTKTTVKIVISVIWLFSTIVCCCTIITGRYIYMENFFHCVLDWGSSKVMTLVLTQIYFTLPLLLLVCFNVFIVKAVLKSRRFLSRHAAATPPIVGFFKEHQTSLLTVAIIAVFLILWTPYFFACCSLALKHFRLLKEFMSAALLLVVSNASVNPFIYGVMNNHFRTAFKTIICMRKYQ